MAKQWSAALGAVSSFETRHARGPGAFTPITPISRLWYSGFVQSRGLSDVRNGVDKFARVIGPRIVEQCPALALLDNAAVAQDDGVIAHHANHVEVVADEEQRQIVLASQPVEQLQDHRLYRNVKRGRGFVQYQQAWAAGDGASDTDAGLLAAG